MAVTDEEITALTGMVGRLMEIVAPSQVGWAFVVFDKCDENKNRAGMVLHSCCPGSLQNVFKNAIQQVPVAMSSSECAPVMAMPPAEC